MDPELPYADDVPYEAQIPSPTEPVGGASLKERIGNRIYLLEDSMSRKRKLVDVEETEQTEGEHGEEAEEDASEAELPYRPNALLIQGPPITHLPTARVFAYATHFDAHPIGLEWVDDQTCVLVFASRRSALQAWDALRKVPPLTDPADIVQPANAYDEAFYPALPLPLALYPIEERINSVLGNSKTAALKEAMQIRWARSSDVKVRGARVQSEFYKQHGHTAGKESLPQLFRAGGRDHFENGNKRRRHNEDDGETKLQLDAELDTFLDGKDEDASNEFTPRVDPRVDTRRRDGTGRRLQDAEEKRRRLDDELDSFLAHGDDPEQPVGLTEPDEADGAPSLLDRTIGHDRPYKSLPRRGPGRGRDERVQRPETGGDGRWLHNAEIIQRKRTETYERDGFGMRAWSPAGEEPHRQPRGGRSKKPRKTQDELDQELESFSREGE